MKRPWILWTGVCLAVLGVCGCAGRAPLYLDPQFGGVHRVALLPVVDRRADRSDGDGWSRKLSERARHALEKKHYRVLGTDGPATEMDQVAEMADDDLLGLIPDGADALAVVYLEDVQSEFGLRIIWMTYEFHMELTGKLLTRGKGIVWRDKAIRTIQGGGILDALFQRAVAEGTYASVVDNLMSTIPEAR